MDLPAGPGRRAQPGPESLQVVLQILLPTLALHTIEKWLWNRSLGKGTSGKQGHCSHPGTRGSHGHRSGDTECCSLLTSVSGCHLSEAFCCFSFAHTANTKSNKIYATSLEKLVFKPVKYTHEFFPLPFKTPSLQQSRNALQS